MLHGIYISIQVFAVQCSPIYIGSQQPTVHSYILLHLLKVAQSLMTGHSSQHSRETMFITVMIFLLCTGSCAIDHTPDTFLCVTPLDSTTCFLVSQYAPRPMTTSCYDVIPILSL